MNSNRSNVINEIRLLLSENKFKIVRHSGNVQCYISITLEILEHKTDFKRLSFLNFQLNKMP